MDSASFLSLNNFDLAVLAIIFLSTLIALIRGFIKTAISVVGWITSAYIAMKFYFILVPIVGKYILLDSFAAVLSTMALFIISSIIIAIINNVFYLAFAEFCGGLLDRSIGMLLGFVRGCALVSIIFYIIVLLMPQIDLTRNGQENYLKIGAAPKWAKGARSIILLNRGADIVEYFVPQDLERKLKIVLLKEESDIHRSRDRNKAEQALSADEKIALILNLVPKKVLNIIPGDALIMLQDSSAPIENRIKVLKDITQAYQDYMSEDDSQLSSEDINKRNLQYYETLSRIEELVAANN